MPKKHLLAPIEKNKCYSATITGMTHDGNGVCKIEDFTVFVPQTAVGDKVIIKVVKVLRHYGFGIVQSFEAEGEGRVDPDCDVFRSCGGCCYRHLSYETELSIKWQQVADSFARLGHIDLKPQPIIGSTTVDAYRNKAQFPLARDGAGHAITGFFAPRSHRVVPCLDCKLLPPVFNEIASATLALIDEFQLPVYEEITRTGSLRHLYLRRAEVTGQIQVCLVSATKKVPHLDAVCAKLTAQFSDIHSIVLNYNPRPDNVILGKVCTTVWGADAITDVLCGVTVQITPLSFYQVNHAQAEALYRKALDYAAVTDGLLMDLYCGIGTIGLAAAHQVGQLIGVEVIPEAIEAAKQNAAQNGFENTRFLAADCKEAVQLLLEEGLHPEVIIVDPPRKGCDLSVIEALVKLSPDRIVMVSCNPATAARDCDLLQQQGYQVTSYQPFDLFPRTHHVECVICLSK